MATFVLTVIFSVIGLIRLFLGGAVAAEMRCGGGRALLIAAGACIALAAGGVCDPVRAEDCEEGSYGCRHAENHDQYRSWHREDRTDGDGIVHKGLSCCNEGDCRPTRAYRDDDGIWHAWDGETWVRIPPSAMLKPDILGDGRSHYCSPPHPPGVPSFPPYCFSAGQTRI